MTAGPRPVPISRRGLLGASLASPLALAGCGGGTERTVAIRPVRHRYGPGPQQYGDLYRPRRSTSRGTVVLVHGGFWQQRYTLSLGADLAADLARRGWVAWNIEYRRIGNGGGWPGTFTDVSAAVDHLAQLDVDTSGVVGLGHSAGGQLVAWLASRRGSDLLGGAPRVRLGAVVPQAGVLDLRTAARTDLGGSAVPDLLGGPPARVASRYALADPRERLPLGVRIRCVHGTEDTTVPISQSRDFVAAARAAGDDAQLVEVPGDHFALIDTGSTAWRRTVEVLAGLS